MEFVEIKATQIFSSVQLCSMGNSDCNDLCNPMDVLNPFFFFNFLEMQVV